MQPSQCSAWNIQTFRTELVIHQHGSGSVGTQHVAAEESDIRLTGQSASLVLCSGTFWVKDAANRGRLGPENVLVPAEEGSRFWWWDTGPLCCTGIPFLDPWFWSSSLVVVATQLEPIIQNKCSYKALLRARFLPVHLAQVKD